MPKVSRESAAEFQDIGIGTVSSEIAGGYEFAFLDLKEETDLAPLLKGLPDDQCQCVHWGHVVRGSVTFTFADHAETFEAGDAFYVPPSHTPASAPGTEYLLITPADKNLEELDSAIQHNLKALQAT